MTPEEIAYTAVRNGAVQKPAELAELLELLCRRRPVRSVEIGVYHGGTLWAWRQVTTSSVLGIESGVGVHEVRPMPDGTYVIPRDSHEPATVDALRGCVKGRPIDFLFIDGDHTYAGVRRDWELYSPLVRRNGGLVAFHDICHHRDPDMGVERLWAEIKHDASALLQTWEFIAEPTWWGGIGVVRL